MKVFRFILGLVILMLIPGYAMRFYYVLASADLDNIFLRCFLFGICVSFILWIIVIRRAEFFLTFEHEMTHLLIGLLFFKNPVAFWATESEGGFVQLYGHNFIIGLAPYFLPTISFLLMPAIFIIQAKYLPHFFILLGLTTGYHIFSTIREFNYNQPDIQNCGKIFSTLFLILMNIICYGILLAFVLGGFSYVGYFLKSGCLFSFELWRKWL